MKQQQYLLALVLAGIATQAPAQTSDEKIVACGKVNDRQQRLVCFDNLARAIESSSGSAGQVQGQVPLVSSGNPVAPVDSSNRPSSQSFGLEHKEFNEGLADDLRAFVTDVEKNSLGKLLLVLDNGQTWLQKDAKTLIIHKGDSVLIERGFMNAFYLSAGDKKRIAVARVK